MAPTTCDAIVIGAGIAGVSAASELARDARVVVLEQEAQPAYHTTGRSAAIYTQTYGNATIRALTIASHAFLQEPPEGFAEHTLLGPRGALFVARADQLNRLEPALAEARALVPSVRRVTTEEAIALNPALRPDYVAAGVYEPDAMDIDVHALHGGFLRRLTRRGGKLVTRAEVQALTRTAGTWHVTSRAGAFEAPMVINAAGAWCDVVAEMAGVAPVGLQPKRRTVMTFPAPSDLEIATWPLTIDIDEQFYFKPEAGTILGSPADETPSPPCDAQPEELDIAIAADRIEQATRLKVTRILSKWAGLRSFVSDKTPVVGFDDQAEGFFWLAGQGGYGIQTAAALARAAAALASGQSFPADLQAAGATEDALSVRRLR